MEDVEVTEGEERRGERRGESKGESKVGGRQASGSERPASNDEWLLGRSTTYVDVYSPELLQAIERSRYRRALELPERPLATGEDVWLAYEFSWLNASGKPHAAALSWSVSSDSPNVVESKSVKLYLNSFASTAFAHESDVLKALQSDLDDAFGSETSVRMIDVRQLPRVTGDLRGYCLDGLDVDINTYEYDPELLALESEGTAIRQAFHSHLFRTLCPVTGQPDWASIYLEFFGKPIDRVSLLEYLVSFRNHHAFHESVVETIAHDLMRFCGYSELTVYGRFLRRGGIEISPYRSTLEAKPNVGRTARQ